MKISTKGQYAVRIMLEIAKSKELLSVSAIAKKQNISPKYLEQIVSLLVKNSLLESVRGHLGGYKLTKSLDQINVKEILDTTGDACNFAPCVSGECERKSNCQAVTVWTTLGGLVNDYLSSVTLKDLLEKSNF